MELEVLKMLIDTGGQMVLDIRPYCKVNVNQFYGIELEEFPCKIAQVGMWLMDHQMNTLVAEHFGLYFTRLPLRASATIVNGNALRLNWEDIVHKNELDYILGNPPFIGSVFATTEQKSDMAYVFADKKRVGILDYVAGWYMKAAEFINRTNIMVAFVSTNSITQGEQVPALWKELIDNYKIIINFAYRTFKWTNEASRKAAVHCVIIGFSQIHKGGAILFDSENADLSMPAKKIAINVNPYLIDGQNIIIEPRSKSICGAPPITRGNMPYDGNNLIIEDSQMEQFLKDEPSAKPYIKRLIGAKEYINNEKRWCLWLVNVSPSDLRKMPLVLDRVEKVRKMRLNSPDISAQKLANSPTLFREQNNPDSYIVIPTTSSIRRKYIPIGLLNGDTIPTNAVHIISGATLFLFGILISKIHMAWVRAICSRLKSDYRYSKNIVYNNFPFLNPTEKQKEAIEKAAQGILDARALYPDSSLADLYDPLTMPPELVKAHNNLDRTVVAAYGGKGYKTEEERVADLMERYQQLVNNK